MSPTTRFPTEPEPPTDDPLPAPSDAPVPPPPEDPDAEPEDGQEPEADPEITDEPLPPPEDPREDEPPLREQEDEEPDGSVELETEGEVFDCGMVDPGCHVSNWFADFVVSGINPALGWLAEKAFFTPLPTAGMEALHSGILATSNAFYVIFVVVGGIMAMCFQTVQTRYSVADILPRLVFGFIASNFSLWVAREMVHASNQIALAIGAQGINARKAAENLRDQMDVLLEEALVFILLLLVVVVVLLVTWILTEAVRICMVIVLVIAAPMLLMFHALPQTTRLAELWWRSMAGLCAIPVAQSVVFIAMARLFFEGQMTIFGSLNPRPGEAAADAPVLDGTSETVLLASSVLAAPETEVRDSDWLLNIMLFLVLLYVQIRISSWVMKLVWQPNPGTSPIAALLKNIAWMMAFRSVGSVRGASGLLKNGVDLGFRLPGSLGFMRGGFPGRSAGSTSASARSAGAAFRGSGGLQPLRPQAWWYRHRDEARGPVGALPGERRPGLVGRGDEGPSGPAPRDGGPSGPVPPAGGPPGPAPRIPGPPGSPSRVPPGLPPAPSPPSSSSPPSLPAPPAARRGALPEAPASRRRALEVGGMPGSPAYGQQTLFPRPVPNTDKGGLTGPATAPRRRWRQEVLPVPPSQRVPGRGGPQRARRSEPTGRPERPGPARRSSAGLRHLPEMPELTWNKPPHVKGQRPLFANPKKRWKQYGLFDRPDRKTE